MPRHSRIGGCKNCRRARTALRQKDTGLFDHWGRKISPKTMPIEEAKHHLATCPRAISRRNQQLRKG